MGGTRQQRNAPNATVKTKKEFKQLRQRKQSEAEELAQQESTNQETGSQYAHRPQQVVDERGLPYMMNQVYQIFNGTNNSGQTNNRYYKNPSPWLPGGYAAFRLGIMEMYYLLF